MLLPRDILDRYALVSGRRLAKGSAIESKEQT